MNRFLILSVAITFAVLVQSRPQFQTNSQFQSQALPNFQGQVAPRFDVGRSFQFQSPQTTTRSQFQANAPIQILSHTHNQDEAGQFTVDYRSADGTTYQEQGVLKPTRDGSDRVLVKTGSYSYLNDRGETIRVDYTADEYGFHPISDSIPKQ